MFLDKEDQARRFASMTGVGCAADCVLLALGVGNGQCAWHTPHHTLVGTPEVEESIVPDTRSASPVEGLWRDTSEPGFGRWTGGVCRPR